MKKLLLIGVAALLATVNIEAGPTEGTGMAGITMPAVLFPGASNWVSQPVINVSKQKDVAFQMTSTPLAAPGCTNQYFLAPSLDSISFDTNAADLTIISNSIIGTATVTTVIKPASAPGAVNYYKLVSSVTSGTSSNNAFGYSSKIGFP